jgi:hypothetical protein
MSSDKELIKQLYSKIQENNIIISDLQAKLKAKTVICSICCENEISICCAPCGHTYCNQCMTDITTCHYCRSYVPIKFKIFIQ